MSYNRETYHLGVDAMDRLALARVSPRAVIDVLYGSEPVVRRHIGSTLQIAGRDRHGRWLAVALVENADDQYDVTGARYVDRDEVDVLEKLTRREQP